MLEANPDKIKWGFLSENPNAIHLMEQNPEKIIWIDLAKNPSIFEIDKTQYKIDITEKANSHFMEIDTLIYKN